MKTERLPIREAAKIILYDTVGNQHTDEREIVLVRGSRGMLNLPGGGLDERESPEDAVGRELFEELSLRDCDMSDIEAIGGTWGTITTATGESKRALWHLFRAKLKIPSTELVYSSEITGLDLLTSDGILAHDNISKLAQQAIIHEARMSR